MGKSDGLRPLPRRVHFVARGVLALTPLASIGTWTLIATKGFRLWRAQRQSASFLSAFWAAPNLELLPRAFVRTAPTSRFTRTRRLHGDRADNCRQRGEAGPPCSKRRPRRPADAPLNAPSTRTEVAPNSAETLLATASGPAAPFVGLFGTVWGISSR